MRTKAARVLISIILAFGIFVQPAFQAGQVQPVQAASALAPQWILNSSPLTEGYDGSLYGKQIALSSNSLRRVIGASHQTVGGHTNQGSAFVYWDKTYNQMLHASDGAAGDHFGISVAISGDGSTILVGASLADVSGHSNQGAVYVFTLNGTTWGQQTKLVASDGAANDTFGSAVALSNNGDTAVIGASGLSESAGAGQGGVYVFTRSSGNWSQQTVSPILPSNAAAGDALGAAVAVSADGNTLVASAVGRSQNSGTLYVYIRLGALWLFQHECWAWDPHTGDDLGRSVAISSDGNTILVGADKATVNGHAQSGAAYTFTRSVATWSAGVKLVSPDGGANDWFGNSVSLSGNGAVAVIGAPQASPFTNNQQGEAYVFYDPGFSRAQDLFINNSPDLDQFGAGVATDGDGSEIYVGASNMQVNAARPGGDYNFMRDYLTWWQQYNLENHSWAANSNVGNSLALSSDGNTAIIGAPGQKNVFIYTRTNNAWLLQATLTAGDPKSYNFGNVVAISSDGNTALVGSSSTDVGSNSFQGKAYLFYRTGASWSSATPITLSSGQAYDYFGLAVALSGDGTVAAISAPYGDSQKGAVYVMSRISGNTWTALTSTQADDPLANSGFGLSVSLSNDGSTMLVGAKNASDGTTNTGAAYAFVSTTGNHYTQQQKLLPTSSISDNCFGASSALSANGNSAVVGAPWSEHGIPGSVYFFTRSGTVWTLRSGFSAPDGYSDDQFGISVGISADGASVIVGKPSTFINTLTDQGAAYIYYRKANSLNFGGRLVAPDGANRDMDGFVVAMSGDGNTILFDGFQKDGSRGGVYFWTNAPFPSFYLPLIRK